MCEALGSIPAPKKEKTKKKVMKMYYLAGAFGAER
jgi:hypothetical protein